MTAPIKAVEALKHGIPATTQLLGICAGVVGLCHAGYLGFVP